MSQHVFAVVSDLHSFEVSVFVSGMGIVQALERISKKHDILFLLVAPPPPPIMRLGDLHEVIQSASPRSRTYKSKTSTCKLQTEPVSPRHKYKTKPNM